MRKANNIILKSCSRGRLFLCLIVTVVLIDFGFAQKAEIIHRSDFKHDYLVQEAEYLENLDDTVSSKYVSLLKITIINQPINIAFAYPRIAQAVKKTGANVFYLVSYAEKDSSITLVLRSFYAFKKTFDLNLTKRKKNKVIVFSTERRSGFYQGFYLNDSLVRLNTIAYFQFTPMPGIKYTIGTFLNSGPREVNTSSIPPVKKISFEVKEDSEIHFLTLYTSEYKTKEEIKEEGKSKIAICWLQDIDYRSGRLLLEVLKSEN